MIFDEVDQGVGGAVADAVGLRLKRLAGERPGAGRHPLPQVAARADAHWRIAKAGEGERVRTAVEDLVRRRPRGGDRPHAGRRRRSPTPPAPRRGR